MIRSLVVLAVVELLAPERVIEFGERLSLENPGECSLRSWVPFVARLEGAVFLSWLVKPRPLSGAVRSILGWSGLMAVISPEGYLGYWTDLVYEDAERLQWKPWVVPLTRVIGICYVLLALFGWNPKEDGDRKDE